MHGHKFRVTGPHIDLPSKVKQVFKLMSAIGQLSSDLFLGLTVGINREVGYLVNLVQNASTCVDHMDIESHYYTKCQQNPLGTPDPKSIQIL